jgi:hypothetical protein
MAPKKDDKKEEKPQINFDKLNKELNVHAQGKHLTDITERLLGSYLSHKSQVYKNKGIDEDDTEERELELNKEEAEELGNKLYNTLRKYAGIKHSKIPKELREGLEKVKGTYDESPLELITAQIFGLERHTLIDALKKRADAGGKFSEDYIRSLFKKSLEHYHGHRERQLIKNKYKLNELDHMDVVKKQGAEMINKYGITGAQKSQFQQGLKSRNFEEVLDAYTNIASSHYKAPEEKPK